MGSWHLRRISVRGIRRIFGGSEGVAAGAAKEERYHERPRIEWVQTRLCAQRNYRPFLAPSVLLGSDTTHCSPHPIYRPSDGNRSVQEKQYLPEEPLDVPDDPDAAFYTSLGDVYCLLSHSLEDYLPPMSDIIFPGGVKEMEYISHGNRKGIDDLLSLYGVGTSRVNDEMAIALGLAPPKAKPSGKRTRKDAKKDKRSEKRKRVQY